MKRLTTSCTAALLFAVVASPASAQTDLANLQARVAALKEQVVELAGDGTDYLDTLYFAWFDRPYARATLAILIKAVGVLECEADVRKNGSGSLDDATLHSILDWSDRALQRVVRSNVTEDFQLHRLPLTKKDLSLDARTPPLYAFIDGVGNASPTAFGSMDLLAALGQRVYTRDSLEDCAAERSQVIADRADALGMVLVDRVLLRIFPAGRPVWGDRGELLALAPVHPVFWTLFRSIADTWPPPSEERGGLPAVFDEDAETLSEFIAASVARRALIRGVFFGSRYAAMYCGIPGTKAAGQDRGPVAAVMWIHAFDGQLLGLINESCDHHSRSDQMCPSLCSQPGALETTAHTALDVLRLGTFLEGFSQPPLLVLTVDANVADSAHPNQWAPWALSIWERLVSRQTRFDLVPSGVDPQRLRDRYRILIPLELGDASRAILTIERRLALDSEHVNRLTARETDGTVAKDVFLRVGKTPGGRACVGIVNLSDAPRVLKLRGRPAVGPSKDVISQGAVPVPNDRVDFGPWQVRLLWPSDE